MTDKTDKEDKTTMEHIEEMLEEARHIMEDARSEARELKRKAREEWRKERHHRRLWHDEARKERVLNLRIGTDLEEKIKLEAERLRVPVSTLVRNVLDNAFELVGGVAENVGNLVEDVVENAGKVKEGFKSAVKEALSATDFQKPEKDRDETAAPEQASIEDVLMWREVTLGKPVTCAACNASIPRGQKAHAGEHEKTKSTLFLCGDCVEKLKV